MEPSLHQDSPAWIFFVHASFAVALVAMLAGIAYLPQPLMVRGYLAMGLLFVVSATLTLSKTVRDNHEARKLHHRIAEVKTEKMLKEYDLK
jgi:hypothetical protein